MNQLLPDSPANREKKLLLLVRAPDYWSDRHVLKIYPDPWELPDAARDR